MTPNPEINSFDGIDEMSEAAAELVAGLAASAVREKGRFSLVLAGGGTPRTLYETLAKQPFVEQMPWERVHIFWGDERCVPPDHPDSNFAMAKETLLAGVAIPPDSIHRIQAEIDPPEAGAEEYEQTLRNFFAGERPSFDLVLLGMGSDGHTASLFPCTSILEEEARWVEVVFPVYAVPPVPRVSLTLPLINQAENIAFLVSGPEKEKVAKEILDDPDAAADTYPAARVRPQERLVWFISKQ
jgi:6-phosphogluconolactonase